ncbi:MAG: M23 family metallopeptidase [Bacillota bacterium]|nr:M23 family metallopeptidase [Bacillota bacterium]
MRAKLLKQAGICVLIALALLISKNSNIGILEQGADTVLAQMSVNYTAEDIKEGAQRGVAAVASLPGKVNTAVSVMTGTSSYGDPIDEEFDGDEATIYAVGAGQVTAVGENEEIGKYIRITHGSDGESLYGNLKKTYVEVPSKVKKGQIIGIYEKSDTAEFYYSFREFN